MAGWMVHTPTIRDFSNVHYLMQPQSNWETVQKTQHQTHRNNYWVLFLIFV